MIDQDLKSAAFIMLSFSWGNLVNTFTKCELRKGSECKVEGVPVLFVLWLSQKSGLVWVLRPHQAVIFRSHSWLCAKGLLLTGLRGPYGALGIEYRSAACKAHAIPIPPVPVQIVDI